MLIMPKNPIAAIYTENSDHCIRIGDRLVVNKSEELLLSPGGTEIETEEVVVQNVIFEPMKD